MESSQEIITLSQVREHQTHRISSNTNKIVEEIMAQLKYKLSKKQNTDKDLVISIFDTRIDARIYNNITEVLTKDSSNWGSALLDHTVIIWLSVNPSQYQIQNLFPSYSKLKLFGLNHLKTLFGNGLSLIKNVLKHN